MNAKHMNTPRLGMHLAALAAGFLVSGGAMAQSTWSGTWDWNAPCDPSTCTVSKPGDSTVKVKATVSAYGAETTNGNFVGASIYTGSNSYLGITSSGENSTEPNHSIDNFKKNSNSSSYTNQGGADVAEALLVNFTQAVSLSQVAVSWTWSDSDALIFRWDNGTSAPDMLTTRPDMLPTSVGTAANGWTLVSSGDFSSGKRDFTSALFSSYWLVSTALGSGNNDGFKISSFSGSVCNYAVKNGECKPPSTGGGGAVPEPGTLALAAAAFLGLTNLRRRRRDEA